MTSHTDPDPNDGIGLTTDNPYQFGGDLGYYTFWQEPNFNLIQIGLGYYDPAIGRYTQEGYNDLLFACIKNRGDLAVPRQGFRGSIPWPHTIKKVALVWMGICQKDKETTCVRRCAKIESDNYKKAGYDVVCIEGVDYIQQIVIGMHEHNLRAITYLGHGNLFSGAMQNTTPEQFAITILEYYKSHPKAEPVQLEYLRIFSCFCGRTAKCEWGEYSWDEGDKMGYFGTRSVWTYVRDKHPMYWWGTLIGLNCTQMYLGVKRGL